MVQEKATFYRKIIDVFNGGHDYSEECVMKNEEIYGFVNSKDIRDHLISTGYEFSTEEALMYESVSRMKKRRHVE